MNQIPTDKLALQVWWALTWRSMPLALVAAMLAGAVIGLLTGVLGGGPEDVQVPAGICGFLIGLFVTIKVVKYLMTKGFGQYRLVVVKK